MNVANARKCSDQVVTIPYQPDIHSFTDGNDSVDAGDLVLANKRGQFFAGHSIVRQRLKCTSNDRGYLVEIVRRIFVKVAIAAMSLDNICRKRV